MRREWFYNTHSRASCRGYCDRLQARGASQLCTERSNFWCGSTTELGERTSNVADREGIIEQLLCSSDLDWRGWHAINPVSCLANRFLHRAGRYVNSCAQVVDAFE